MSAAATSDTLAALKAALSRVLKLRPLWARRARQDLLDLIKDPYVTDLVCRELHARHAIFDLPAATTVGGSILINLLGQAVRWLIEHPEEVIAVLMAIARILGIVLLFVEMPPDETTETGRVAVFAPIDG